MTKKKVPLEKWENYLQNLYDWINEKYSLFESKIITEEEYNEHLSYYDTEKERIEDIISTTKDNETDQKENNSFLRKETFENFFGVTLEDEANKVQQNQNTPKTQSISTDHVYHDANISVERKDKIRSELETV
ncbi:MAG: hypothetical protein OEZ01_12090, partial [Candidatus Heimdallarchaeota archaeon]|nr:hypothetical protein [Candidatus Heimdallarchaeota archaeon]